MKVELLQATPEPAKTVCKSARNDYLDGWIHDMTYDEIMDSVDGNTIEEKEENLLTHLIKQEHYGPIEHVHASFSITGLSRVVMAQATRHRHLSWDIQSQRYVDFSDDSDYTIPKTFTDTEHFTRDDGVVDIEEEYLDFYKSVFQNNVETTIKDYDYLVGKGVPKEDARYILPTAMQVNAVMSGNLRALMHVVNMRSKGNVQGETREFAEKVSDAIEEWCPTIHAIFDEQMPMRLGL